MDQARRSIVRQVFRCIVRHVRYLENPELNVGITVLKRSLRRQSPTKHSSQAWRKRISTLFDIEKSLRKIEENKLTVSQFKNIYRITNYSSQLQQEKNQVSSIHLWLQHESRRFDEYNAPPAKGSPQFKKVDTLAKFSDVSNRFAQHFGVSANNLVVQTILAPYWKQNFRTRKLPLRPRPVEIRNMRRNSGTLWLLRVRGIAMRAKGLRRHIAEVEKSRFTRIANMNFQVWLAEQYANDPLDGEDMSDWIYHTTRELNRLKTELKEFSNKLEVRRRILVRRKKELEIYWQWRHRQRVQAIERERKLNPPKLLTLETL